MKRSRALSLSLLGTAPLALTACRSEEPMYFRTLPECLSDGRVSNGQCQSAYSRALQTHLSSAPRFPTTAACEASYGPGGCEIAPGGANWSPRMSGFVVGMYERRWFHSPTLYTGGVWDQRPLYRTRDDWSSGSWSTGDGRSWGGSHWSGSSGSSWSKSGDGGSSEGKISTSTLSRGGFGGASSARSSWGG